MTWLIEASAGGKTRARILLALREKPMNPHMLARRLGLNYRTITHHLRILEKHGLVERLYQGHGAPYALTSEVEENWDLVSEYIERSMGGEECRHTGRC